MKIGIMAYSSPTGLGIQMKELYDHLHPAKTLVVDLSDFNKMPVNYNWYMDGRFCKGFPQKEDFEWLCGGVDVVFYAETPLNYSLHLIAKERGVKVVQQHNVEFLDYFKKPFLPKPTILASPSTWRMKEVQELMNQQEGTPVEYLPVPVNRKKLPFRRRNKLETLIHIIGRPAYMDRNGTDSFLDLVDLLGPKYRYIIYYQEPSDQRAIQYFEPVKKRIEEFVGRGWIKVKTDLKNYNDLYTEGDLLILPRRYGGLCLVQQEALSTGMPVIMTDMSPNRDKLPPHWLCYVKYKGNFNFHSSVDVYEADSENLLKVVNQFEDQEFYQNANKQADEIAEQFSWSNMKDKYLEFFKKL